MQNDDLTKKANQEDEDNLRPEYDFSKMKGGVPMPGTPMRFPFKSAIV